jgi:hypothetical protein
MIQEADGVHDCHDVTKRAINTQHITLKVLTKV